MNKIVGCNLIKGKSATTCDIYSFSSELKDEHIFACEIDVHLSSVYIQNFVIKYAWNVVLCDYVTL